MDFMLYPADIIHEEMGVIPNVSLPEDWRELVPRFYEQGRKEDIEEFTKNLETILNRSEFGGGLVPAKWEVRLNWDDVLGLTNISTGADGLDLDERDGHYGDHNLSTENGFVVGCVARKYVEELLKSRPSET